MKEFLPDSETMTDFLDSAGKCIYILNENMLSIESGNISDQAVNEMFRAAHSIKGVAGMFNFTNIAELTHNLETILDGIRNGTLKFSQEVIENIFEALDLLSVLLADVATGRSGGTDISHILEKLRAIFDKKDKSDSKDLEEELGKIPEFVKGKFGDEDIFQSLCAKNSGKRVYMLRFSLKYIICGYKDIKKFYNDIKSSVNIQNIFPIVNDICSPWEPLENYDYQIGIFCFTQSDIREALINLEILQYEAWELCTGDSLEHHIIIEKTPVSYPDEKISSLIIKSGMEKHLATFLCETKEELDRIDISIMSWEEDSDSQAYVRDLFLFMHRLKSSCASMGFDEMSRVAHNCESILAIFRENIRKADKGIFQLLYHAKDYLVSCIQKIEANETAAPESNSLDEKFKLYLKEDVLINKEDVLINNDAVFDNSSKKQLIENAAKNGQTVWKVTVKLFEKAPMADLRCSMILKNLEHYAKILYSQPNIEELEAGVEKVPVLYALIAGEIDQVEINNVINVDMVEQSRIEKIADAQKVPKKVNDEKRENSAPSVVKQSSGEAQQPVSVRADTLRVDTARIDDIMNMAGELAVTKARIVQLVEVVTSHLQKVDMTGLESLIKFAEKFCDNKDNAAEGNRILGMDRVRKLDSWINRLKTVQERVNDLKDTSLVLHRHTSKIQNLVMQMRMVPIGPLFQRFGRLVRDLCKEKTKNAKLIISGENTELDKKLIDELADPLTHLIRNSVDHGLENEKDRLAAGKSGQGSIFLSAFHEGGQICIQVKDDGQGLDIVRIKEKGVEKGLIDQNALKRMTEQEAIQLIFAPGFSTAQKVTNISGRGVGMDIVKNKVNELKGKIEIDSTPGKGVCFNIRLPLTLAMIRSLLVEIGQTRYAFPLESIKEIVEKETKEIKRIENKGHVIFLRDDVISLIDLSDTICIDPLHSKGKDGQLIKAVVIRGAGEIFAIPVDRIIGEEEIVVKALPDEFLNVKGISGATILGDGGIALILDVDAVLEANKRFYKKKGCV